MPASWSSPMNFKSSKVAVIWAPTGGLNILISAGNVWKTLAFFWHSGIQFPSLNRLPQIWWSAAWNQMEILVQISTCLEQSVSTRIKDYKGTRSPSYVSAIQIEDVGLDETLILTKGVSIKACQQIRKVVDKAIASRSFPLRDSNSGCLIPLPARKDSNVKLHMCDKIETWWPMVSIAVGEQHAVGILNVVGNRSIDIWSRVLGWRNGSAPPKCRDFKIMTTCPFVSSRLYTWV